MKKILLGTFLVLLNTLAHATNGLENIIVEKYYVSNAADAAGSSGALPVGSVTYRIFADMLPGYNFQAIYGVPGHTMTVQTSTSFFNNEDFGGTTPTISTTNVRKNSALLDSYFSVGGAANGKVGVLKTEDTDGSPGNAQNILQNNDVSAGGPINIGTITNLSAHDGMIAGSPVAVTYVGISTGELSALDDLSQTGNLFTTANGSVAALGGAVGPTSSNRVLIGQFTTNGVFSFELNVQIGTPTGGVQNYVACNPVGNEIQLPSLNYNFKLDLKLFIEGFYQGNGMMAAVADPASHPNVCDTITVELHDAVAPYNVAESKTGVISTTGNGSFFFTSLIRGNSYYVAVRHRNAIETWSKNPVLFNAASVDFDLTRP